MSKPPSNNVLPFRTPERRKAEEDKRLREEAYARILAYAKTLPQPK